MVRIIEKYSQDTGYTKEQCSGVFAATSINTKWDRNLLLANKALTVGLVKEDALGIVVKKVESILSGTVNVEDALSKFPTRNQKILNFKRNLSGNFFAVTVDRWAHRVATKDTTATTPKGKRYSSIMDAYIEVAQLVNLAPAEVQAITWLEVQKR